MSHSNHETKDDDGDNDEFYDTQNYLDDEDNSFDDNLNENQSSLEMSVNLNPHKERVLFAVQFIDSSKINESKNRFVHNKKISVKLGWSCEKNGWHAIAKDLIWGCGRFRKT